VVDRALGEAAARGQARVPGADDDGGDPFGDQATSTVTFTGLVIAS
jgi:hypothetical protein